MSRTKDIRVSKIQVSVDDQHRHLVETATYPIRIQLREAEAARDAAVALAERLQIERDAYREAFRGMLALTRAGLIDKGTG